MFDNGTMIILSKEEHAAHMESLRKLFEPGATYVSPITDGKPRDWWCEPLDPAEHTDKPDVYAYLLSRPVENPT
jgi:hypothetical protein